MMRKCTSITPLDMKIHLFNTMEPHHIGVYRRHNSCPCFQSDARVDPILHPDPPLSQRKPSDLRYSKGSQIARALDIVKVKQNVCDVYSRVDTYPIDFGILNYRCWAGSLIIASMNNVKVNIDRGLPHQNSRILYNKTPPSKIFFSHAPNASHAPAKLSNS
jgi:hypothetical protein